MLRLSANSRRGLLAFAAAFALLAISCSKLGDPVVDPDPVIPPATSGVPAFSPQADTTIREGDLLTLDLSATDPKSLGLVYTLKGIGELNGDQWSWRPDLSRAGVYPIRLIVSVQGHPEWADTLDFNVTVLDDPEPAPWINIASEYTVFEGQFVQLPLTAVSPRNRGVTYSVSGPPGAGMAFSTGNSTTFAWTPSYTQAGRHEVVFTVTEMGSEPRSRSQTTIFTVLDVDRPPVLQALRDTTVDTSMTLQLTLSATDPDGDSIIYSMPGRPTGSTLNGAVFRWKPRASQIGTVLLRVVATAKGLSDADTAVVTVIFPVVGIDPPIVSAPNPVAHWSLESTSGALDSIGSRHITVFGGPTSVAGVSGKAVRFSGTGYQYGESQAAFPDMTEQTLAAWVYVDSLDRATITLIQESDNASGRDNELSIEQPSGSAAWKFMYRTRDDDGRHFSNGSITAKKWYYLAGVAKRDTVRLYINGLLDRTLTAGPYNVSGNHHRIQLARKNDGSSIYPFYLRGILDEIKLFNKALTAPQIQAEWNRHKAAAGY